MASTDIIGTFTIADGPRRGVLDYSLGDKGAYGTGLPKSVDVTGFLVKDAPLTKGDLVIQTLSTAKGCPPFLASWPEAKKAVARRDIAKWLKNRRVDWADVVKSNPFYYPDYD